MNRTTKKILRTVTGIIVALIIIGGAVWMITGLSPQALIVRAFLKPMTMDKYEEAMNDKTDKSTTEIPAEVKFPREVAEYRVGGMQVFYTDVLKTYEKMKAAGVDVRLHVAEKMGHVYPLIPSPEGRKARKEIADIIRKQMP